MGMRGTFTYRNAIFILLLGVFTYLYGLDSRFAPKNGDEYPYMHIVRMTADAGAWLPLQSEMDGIKNTKPPLVFWEGIASTGWGSNWTLLALRWPSVLYTGLTAFFLFLAVARLSGKKQTGLLAALVWLSFFATYRYGRPFLTDPPEVFWLSLPFFALLYWGRAAFNSKLLFPLLAGACFGMALLSKSFAYIVPASFALGLFYWRWREWSLPQVLIQDLYKVALIAVLALGVFALWFVLDPFPEAVWKEFVLGENVGKFEARSSNYLLDLVRGGDSIWMLALMTLANAGLFTFVLISALMQCWRERRFISLEESLLLLLVLAFFIIFSMPSQRSGRYLLPVMPALAVLIAMYWNRLPLWGFRIALVLQSILLAALTWVGGNLQLSSFLGQPGIWNYSFWHWGLMSASIALVLLGLFNSARCKTLALAGCFCCYSALTSSLSPLEASLGRYQQSTIQVVAGQDVWVPCDYRAKDEEYRLLLPGAILHGYLAKDAGQINLLSSTYPLVAVQSPIGIEPVLCESCKIVGKRMEMRARHSDAEIASILIGQIGEHLFVNEYLISTPAKMTLPLVGKDACR
jgi:4-amino-4-deoxy-L-arabinose transferase-like glycosyltransferase